MSNLEFEQFKPHPFEWIVDSLRQLPSYLEKPMFGCRACYCHGKLNLVLAANDEEPWNGILIPTDKSFHSSLVSELPRLKAHPVLGKWLYLSQSDDEFEDVALAVAKLIEGDDTRVGVEPKRRRTRIRRKRGRS